MMRTIAVLAASTMLAMPALNAQVADPAGVADVAPTAQSPAANQSLISGASRFIELAELGYDRGLEISGLSGTRELYFALPPAGNIAGMRLRLPYRSDSAFESRRSLVIEIGGRTVHTISLASSASQGVIEIPVDPSMARDGFLAVRLVYSGVITEDRCIDQRLSGAFIGFPQNAGLAVEYGPQAFRSVGTFAQLMPPAVTIRLPATPSEAQAAAAMTLTVGNPAASIGTSAAAQIADGVWRSTAITIVGPDQPALQLVRTGPSPELRIGGADPAGTARLLLSRWRALSAMPMVSAAQLNKGERTSDRLTFSDLGGDTSVQSVVGQGKWTVPLPSRALPAGMEASRLVVDLSVSEDGGKVDPVVTVMMNGVLLDSAQVTDPKLTRLDIALPQGLASTQNAIEVSVTRQIASGDCSYAPQGYAAQLLPSSHMLLSGASSISDFSDLSAALNGGYTIVLPDASALASVARIVGPLASSSAPVSVSFGELPQSGTLVVVSDTAPTGTSPALRFDQGQVELTAEGGRSLLDAAALGRTSIVQMLDQGGRSILWIKPGEDFAQLATAAEPLVLGHGDVAILTGERIEIAFSSTRDRLIDIRYPDQTSLGQLLNRYRLWLIGFSWLLISAGFIYLLRRIYAARRAG